MLKDWYYDTFSRNNVQSGENNIESTDRTNFRNIIAPFNSTNIPTDPPVSEGICNYRCLGKGDNGLVYERRDSDAKYGIQCRYCNSNEYNSGTRCRQFLILHQIQLLKKRWRL